MSSPIRASTSAASPTVAATDNRRRFDGTPSSGNPTNESTLIVGRITPKSAAKTSSLKLEAAASTSKPLTMKSARSDAEANDTSSCPICNKDFASAQIEAHVNRCIFLNTTDEPAASRPFTLKRRQCDDLTVSPDAKKKAKPSQPPTAATKASVKASALSLKRPPVKSAITIDLSDELPSSLPAKTCTSPRTPQQPPQPTAAEVAATKSIPLAEQMRPDCIDDYVGQSHIFGADTVLRKVLDRNEVPSMILWGPPGCGKTTLAHIVAAQCKRATGAGGGVRFVKVSATMVGVAEVKAIVQQARNDQKFQRRTVLFMDEIHRFNKLQQDTFLPHVESGVITLIGATTENPSFSLNAALLSRCRVLVLEKLTAADMLRILERSLVAFQAVRLAPGANASSVDLETLGFVPRVLVDAEALQWLADMCDGDARIGLNSLQLAMQSVLDGERSGAEDVATFSQHRIRQVRLDDIKEGVKKSHFLYDRKGDQHYDMISALHKSIRASDDNAALYWCCRMMAGGEDPR